MKNPFFICTVLLLLCGLFMLGDHRFVEKARAQTTLFVPNCSGTNDTPAFQAFITAAAGNPRTITIPWKTTATRCALNTITFPSNITLDFLNGGINRLQPITIQGPIIAPARQIFFGTGTVSFSGNKAIRAAYVEWWGGDPSAAATVTTAAFSAANAALVTIGAGDIVMGGSGTYLTNGAGITLGSNTVGAFTGIGLRGTNGLVGSKMSYSGTGDAITLTNGRYNRLTDFDLVQSGSKGTSRGIVITGPGGGGAFTFFSEVERVTVSNFHIGIENGNTVTGKDADLVDFNHVTLEGNNIGLKVTGINSTMIHARNTSVGRSATYGVYLTAGGGTQVNWQGGTMGGNAVSFFNDGTNANYDIQGIRDEWVNLPAGVNPNYQFIRNEASTGIIKVSNYLIAGVGTMNYPVISNSGGTVIIESSGFVSTTLRAIPFGPSTAGAQVGFATTLIMRGNRINENVAEFSSNGNLAGASYTLGGNQKFSDAGAYTGMFADDHGVIESLSGNGNRLSLAKITWNASSSLQSLLNLNRMLAANVTAPSTPASGYTELYVNTANKTFCGKDDAGVVKCVVQPTAAVSNQWINSISSAGVPTQTQPGFSDLSGSIAFSQNSYTPVSPAAITANQNNYNPGAASPYVRLTSDASRNITGLTFTVAQVDGQSHTIVNIGLSDIVLKHQDAASTAANRFFCSTAADITLTPKQAADVIYDSTNAYWLVWKKP